MIRPFEEHMIIGTHIGTPAAATDSTGTGATGTGHAGTLSGVRIGMGAVGEGGRGSGSGCAAKADRGSAVTADPARAGSAGWNGGLRMRRCGRGPVVAMRGCAR